MRSSDDFRLGHSPPGADGETPTDVSPDTPTLAHPSLKIPVRVELGPEPAGPDAPTVKATPRAAGSAAASPAPLVRGRAAGRFVVEELIGRGGMGVVYRAFDRDLRRQVAMKVMLGHRSAGMDCGSPAKPPSAEWRG